MEYRGVNGIFYLTVGNRIQRRITRIAQTFSGIAQWKSVCIWNRMLLGSYPATNDESDKTVGGLGTKGL